MKTEGQYFLLAGLLAGAVNVVSRIFFSLFTSYQVAVVLAFPIALSVGFFLNKKFVFSQDATHSDVTAIQYLKFALVNVVALSQVWAVSVVLAKFVFPYLGFTWNSETVAHVVGVASPVATSYLAYKYFVFSIPSSPEKVVGTKAIGP